MKNVKIEVSDLYNQIEDHPYWNDYENQEYWSDIRNKLWMIESKIEELKPWKTENIKFRYEEVKTYVNLYSNAWFPLFASYCHDVRKYLSYSKLFENSEYNLKRYNHLKEWIETVKAFINSAIPIIKTKNCTISVSDYKGCYYIVNYYNSEQKERFIKSLEKYTTCKSDYYREWSTKTINELNDGTGKLYRTIE